MIVGVGIDLVEVSRIRDSMDRFGERFLARILTPAEAAYCAAHPEPAIHVAARFAAKEAVGKAFGTGIGLELAWHDAEVFRNPAGKPEVRLHGKGAEMASALGIDRIHLSLTHTAATAAAVVILECREKN
jgi:holo-[acyl-carrier protein] synthase